MLQLDRLKKAKKEKTKNYGGKTNGKDQKALVRLFDNEALARVYVRRFRRMYDLRSDGEHLLDLLRPCPR